VRPIIHLKFYIWIILDHCLKMPMVTSMYLLSLMPSPDGLSCSPPSRQLLQRQRRSCLIILVDLEVLKSFIQTKELVQELLRLCGIEQSFATAHSSEENGIVERANQEVLRHLRALLFDSRVHDKWSFEQLPLVQLRKDHIKLEDGSSPYTSLKI